MKFIYDTTPVSQIAWVKRAIYLGDYVIRIVFDDGHEQAVDFKAFLKTSSHPIVRKYLNEKKFLAFRIIHGNLNWNDYEMIFPLEKLYNGKI